MLFRRSKGTQKQFEKMDENVLPKACNQPARDHDKLSDYEDLRIAGDINNYESLTNPLYINIMTSTT